MIKVYGMKTCPYCTYIYGQIKNDRRFEVIDIGEHVRYLSEFLMRRDTDPSFEQSKRLHDIGVPCFVLEDGSVSLDPARVGLREYSPKEESCSMDGRGC